MTAAAVALASGGVFVWFSVTCPGPGTLALIVAVPFFFFFVIELTVILFEGAAASGRVRGPVTPAPESGPDSARCR